VVRALSAAVNVQDDNGMLFGNWGKELSEYSGGTHPIKWVGSLKILQKYYEKKKPVKYAQCWVYAGVLTTGNIFSIFIPREITKRSNKTI
jgi:transglutaminase 1